MLDAQFNGRCRDTNYWKVHNSKFVVPGCFFLVNMEIGFRHRTYQCLIEASNIPMFNRGIMAFIVGSVLVLLLATAAARDLKEVRSNLETPEVPDAISVPPGFELHLLLFAKGHQYYRFNGSDWVNFNATAKLFNQELKQIGRHYYLPTPDPLGGQPTWETLPSKGVPYSLVTGMPVARVTVDEDSIAWVLLKATNNSGSKEYFGEVEYIQRINTSGGLGPSDTSGAEVGDVRKSNYTSDYAFYVPE